MKPKYVPPASVRSASIDCGYISTYKPSAYAIKVCCSIEDLNEFVCSKLSDEDRIRFKNKLFFPIKCTLNEHTMEYEVLLMTSG